MLGRQRRDQRDKMLVVAELTKPAKKAVSTRMKASSPRLARTTGKSKASQSSGFGKGLVAGAITGAVGMFIFDPRTGRRRRALVRDKVVRLGHSMQDVAGDSLPKKVDYVSGMARGISNRAGQVMGPTHGDTTIDSKTLTDRVESIVFRDPDIPKGQLNVNTVQGVVYLRGHTASSAMAEEIANRVRKVEGVVDVINLINKPDVDPSDVRLERQEDIIDPSGPSA